MPKSTGVRAAQRAATISRILGAAREEFAEHGPAATVRSIARRAHVDPSLVLQYFTSKEALFIAATAVDDGDTEQHLRDVLAAKLDKPPPETMAVLRSMLTSPRQPRRYGPFSTSASPTSRRQTPAPTQN
jgi:AcrR family transcriptional regulator